MRRLYMPGYYAGYSNMRMALDNAVVLAHLTGRTLVPYRFRMPRRQPVDLQSQAVVAPMLVPELFDLPVPCEDHALLKTWLSLPAATHCAWPPLYDAVVCDGPPPPPDDPDFQQFRNGRRHVLCLTPEQQDCGDLHIQTQPLAHVSHCFHLDATRQAAVVALMRRMQPRAPYRALAEHLVTGLGRYNAVHLRRGDFLVNGLSENGFIRSRRITGQEIVANLSRRMAREDTLVVCTDGTPDDELFGPLQQHFRHTVFLQQHLHAGRAMAERLAALPRFDEDVEALLTQLVASRAEFFAGTLFSTFTALIHRLRAQERGERDFLYCYDDFQSPIAPYRDCAFVPDAEGRYSWNRLRMPITPEIYSWLREWPEAAGLAPPDGPDGLPAPASLTCSAEAALLQGAGLHLRSLDGGVLVVDGWAGAEDRASWVLDLAAAGTWAVALRYASADPSQSARYSVGIEGGSTLTGRVWSTCSPSTLSPWLPIGRLHLPAGRSRLVLRPLATGTGLPMQLQGVRLLPV